jgi:ankyrin repeat protein
MTAPQPPAAPSPRTAAAGRRYYVVARDAPPAGHDTLDAAIAAARRHGEGTDIVDTLARPYHPMVQRIVNGEATYLEFGAWPTLDTPSLNLIEAVKKGCPSIVSAFLAKGADVNARDPRGGTALMWAVARCVPENVRLLIAAGADPNARDQNGMTALKLAHAKDLPNVAALLLQAGAGE